MRCSFLRLPCGMLALWLAAVPVHAGAPVVRRSWLAVGRGWALVREHYEVDLLLGHQRIALTGLPDEMEDSTLVFRPGNPDIRLLRWEREDDPVLAAERQPVLWDRRENALAALRKRHPPPLHIQLHSPVRGCQSFELIYMMTGLTWSAHYQLRTRGDIRRTHAGPFSADITGYARIRNTTGKRFENATITLIGGEPDWLRPARKSPGFLDLPDSPLADLWRPPRPAARPEFRYRVGGRHVIPAHAELGMPLIEALRIPADRVLKVRFDSSPSDLHGREMPLREVIQFDNARRLGLGRYLPAGRVMVFRSGALLDHVTTATLRHSGPNSRIEIELGEDPQVVVHRRHTASHSLEGERAIRHSYVIQLRNNHSEPVPVVVQERPVATPQWSVYSSSVRYVRTGNLLEFRTVIEPAGETRIEYVLSVQKQAW